MSSSASPTPFKSSPQDEVNAQPAPGGAPEPAAAHDDHHEEAMPASRAARESSRDRLLAMARSWAISVTSVLVGLVLWHFATKNGLDFYIRFANDKGGLAWAILGEQPRAVVLPGGALILLGLFIALRSGSRA